MARPGIRRVGVIVLVVGVLAASTGGSGVVSIVGAQSADTVGGVVSQPGNNTTSSPPQQEPPSKVGEDGDLQAVESWLSSRLTARLESSAIQISQGQYETAQGFLNDEYRDTLSKYVDVAGETAGDDAAQRREQFNETAATQSEYARTLETYRETFDAYQTARDNGNEERARELARELRELAARLDALSGSLTTDYRSVGNITGTSFQNEQAAISNTTGNVTEQTATVSAEVFTTTAVTANATPTGSFIDPIVLTGQVTANGSAPLNGTIQLQIADRRVETAVAPNGSFQLEYRPITAPVNQSVRSTVAYNPDPSGTYLGSNTTIQTTARQVAPTLRLTTENSTVGYGESVHATGRVTVGDAGVPNTTVRVRLGGTELARTTTNASGHYTVTEPLPADVETGSQSLLVRVGKAETALAPTSTTAPVRVTTTETTLTMSTTPSADTLDVRGRLQTANGMALAERTVTIQRNGTVVGTAETNDSGVITTQITVPDSAQGTPLRITAGFDGAGTNLASARTATTVTIPGPGGGWGLLLPGLVLGGVGLLGVLGVGYYLRTRTETSDASEQTATAGDGSAAADTTGTDEHAGEQDVLTRLGAAAEHLDAENPDTAVRVLYGAVREGIAPDAGTAGTHWEFYAAVSDDLDTDTRDLLRNVTEAYEGVRFAERQPAVDHVADLLETARTQLSVETGNRNPNQSASPSKD